MLWCGCEIPVRCWKRCLCLGGPSIVPNSHVYSALISTRFRFYPAPAVSSSLSSIHSAMVSPSSLPTRGSNYASLLHMVQQFHLLVPPTVAHFVTALLLSTSSSSSSSCLPLGVWLRGFQALSLSPLPLRHPLFPPEPGLLYPPCVRLPTVLGPGAVDLGAL